MGSCGKSINALGILLLIIGGVGGYIAQLFEGRAISPV